MSKIVILVAPSQEVVDDTRLWFVEFYAPWSVIFSSLILTENVVAFENCVIVKQTVWHDCLASLLHATEGVATARIWLPSF